MSGFVLSAGGFYAYIKAGLGPAFGLAGALIALATYTSVAVALYGLFGFFLNDLVRLNGGPDIAWWIYAVALAIVGLPVRRAQHRVQRPPAGLLHGGRDHDPAGAEHRDPGDGGPGEADRLCAVRRPRRACARAGRGAGLRRVVLPRLRGHRDLRRGSARAQAHHSARHLHCGDADRRLLRFHDLDHLALLRAGSHPAAGRQEHGHALPRRHQCAARVVRPAT